MRDFHKQQLHPGEHQVTLSQKFQDFIDQSLSWDVLKATFVGIQTGLTSANN